jgi:hypothetical protein
LNKRALIREFYAECSARETKGLATYGDYIPETDTRVMAVEIQEELIDTGNYLGFLERKRPDLRGMIQAMRAKTILLYADSKELEKAERTLTREGDL